MIFLDPFDFGWTPDGWLSINKFSEVLRESDFLDFQHTQNWTALCCNSQLVFFFVLWGSLAKRWELYKWVNVICCCNFYEGNPIDLPESPLLPVFRQGPACRLVISQAKITIGKPVRKPTSYFTFFSGWDFQKKIRHSRSFPTIIASDVNVGVSKNSGTPKKEWFITENPIKNGWFRGTVPLCSETAMSMYVFFFPTCPHVLFLAPLLLGGFRPFQHRAESCDSSREEKTSSNTSPRWYSLKKTSCESWIFMGGASGYPTPFWKRIGFFGFSKVV